MTRRLTPHAWRASQQMRAKRGGRGAIVIGQLIWTPDEIRALVRRVNARYVSLNRDVAAVLGAGDATGPGDPLGADWRASWRAAFEAWEAFMRDTCEPSADGRDVCASIRGGWLAQAGWGGTVTQAQGYDRELDQWRAQYAARSGRRPSQPTTSQTADAPEPLAGWRTPVIWVSAAVIVGAVVYAATRYVPPPAQSGGGGDPAPPPPPPPDADPNWYNLPGERAGARV